MSRHWNGLITPLPMNSFLFLTYNSIDTIEPMNRLNNRCIMQHDFHEFWTAIDLRL
jgi:hypothetical protein